QSVLVEPAACHDVDRREPAIVEDPPNTSRVLAEVAAVDTDPGDGDALCRQARRQRYHPACGAFGIVGVDQQDEASRMRTGEMLEGEDLVVMRLDKGMRHRAVDRDAEFEPGG